MGKIIDGKAIAKKIINDISSQASNFESMNKRKPTLAAIIVGNSKSSEIYIKAKDKVFKEAGMRFVKYEFSNITNDEIIHLIDELNIDDKIDGILIQLPLPKKLDQEKIITRVSKFKDVDGFND